MMKLLLIFAFFTVCFSSLIDTKKIEALTNLRDVKLDSHFEKVARDMANFHEHASNLHQSIENNLNQNLKKRGVAECNAALAELQRMLGTGGPCRTLATTIFNPLSTTQQVTDSVNSYCVTGSCQANITQQLAQVVANCDLGIVDLLLVRSGAIYNRMICSKDGDQYCIPKLAASRDRLNTVATNFKNVQNADLDVLCQPCTVKVAGLFALARDPTLISFVVTFRALRGICTQVKGEYCILRFRDFASQVPNDLSPQSATEQQVNNLLTFVCAPCLRVMFARFGLIGVNIGFSFSDLFGFCIKAPDREFCLTKLYRTAKDLITNNNSTSGCDLSQGCTDNCKRLLNKVIGDLGCCAASFFLRIDARIAPLIEQCAGRKLGEPCRSFANATITITFTNLNTTQIRNNLQKFIDSVRKDIKGELGQDLIIVNIDVTYKQTRAGEQAVVTAPVSGPSTAAGSFESSVPLDNVAENFNSANPTQEISSSTSVSNVKVESSSSSLFLSFFLLLIISFFFF